MALAQMGIGAIQTGVAASKASKLDSPQKYTVSPEMRLAYNMARTRADEGFSPEEKAAFEQQLARGGTAARRTLQNVGLAGVGSAAANIMGIDAMNQFAATGANIRRQNFGQFANLANQVQGVQNMETNRFNQRLLQEEQALGGAMQSGIGNMFGGLNAGMNFGQNEQAIDAWKGMGQGGATATPQQTPTRFNSPMSNWGGFNYNQPSTMSGQQPNYGFGQQTPQPFGSQGFGLAPNWNQIWGG